MGSKKGAWYIKTYTSTNGVEEKTKFWVNLDQSEKSKKKIDSAVKRAAKTSDNAEHAAGRLINSNFKAGDIFLSLDLSDDGLARVAARAEKLRDKYIQDGDDIPAWNDLMWMSAQQECVNYIRRCQYELAKHGTEFKYIFVTSDMNPETKEPVRLHFHLLVNKEAEAACLAKWSLGRTNKEPLKNQDDYHPIAEYMIAQVRHIPNMKRYTPSRNLAQAKVGKPRLARSGSAELKPPKKAKLLRRSEYKRGMPQYIRYKKDNKAEPEDNGAD